MQSPSFQSVRLSLAELVGAEYIQSVIEAAVFLQGADKATLRKIAGRKVDFFPTTLQRRLESLLPQVGTAVTSGWSRPARGASTKSFDAATHAGLAPLAGLGCYRLGADGRLYLICKSEHYHASLGHAFPGYQLVDHAKALGIPNATHNNTRGQITRLLEQELVCAANGIQSGDAKALGGILGPGRSGCLNRVLNLETGSIAVEAGLKMMLGRFYRIQPEYPKPTYAGRVPVFVVLGDDVGGTGGNYHGTTIFAQMLRGMWPELAGQMQRQGLVKIVAVRPNDAKGQDAVFAQYEKGRHKIAGLCYEPIMMNYGARLLGKGFVKRIHSLCRRHDVPTLVDEIQTGMWAPQLFAFRQYGVKPDFVVIGKGFPGGEYPASRILFNAAYDYLPQFGALVTNGQEELASLAYLVTMRWAQANADVTAALGEYYQERLHDLAGRHAGLVAGIEGAGHLAAISFGSLAQAKAVVKSLTAAGLDVSVQTYKETCPPAVLTKLPLIAGRKVIDLVVDRIESALVQVEREGTGPA